MTTINWLRDFVFSNRRMLSKAVNCSRFLVLEISTVCTFSYLLRVFWYKAGNHIDWCIRHLSCWAVKTILSLSRIYFIFWERDHNIWTIGGMLRKLFRTAGKLCCGTLLRWQSVEYANCNLMKLRTRLPDCTCSVDIFFLPCLVCDELVCDRWSSQIIGFVWWCYNIQHELVEIFCYTIWIFVSGFSYSISMLYTTLHLSKVIFMYGSSLSNVDFLVSILGSLESVSAAWRSVPAGYPTSNLNYNIVAPILPAF